MRTCPKCNKELEEGEKFCGSCGAQISEVAEETAEENTETKTDKKKPFLFAGVGVAALIAVILLISLFSKGGKGAYGLYLKDDELVYADCSNGETTEITSRLLDGEAFGDYEFAKLASKVAYRTQLSEDGKHIFYPDKLGYSSGSYTLYYRDIDEPKEEPVKIDSEVYQYTINKKGTQVVYIKGSEQNLYLHDLNDKEKIASDVNTYYVSEDGKRIGYLTEEGDYYLWYSSDEKVKMASDISRVVYVSQDLSEVYFIKDESLYKKSEKSEDRVKIASDVSSVEAVYDSGEVYYTKTEIEEKKLEDYLYDDIKGSDDWSEAERREIYNELKNQTFEMKVRMLYYYDGTESRLVTDALLDSDFDTAKEKAVITFKAYDSSNVNKVNLSDAAYTYNVQRLVEDALYESQERYIVTKDVKRQMPQTDAKNIRFTPDGSELYYIDDIEEMCGDLYKVYTENGSRTRLDSDVSTVSTFLTPDKQLVYYKDVDYDNLQADLYIGGVQVDSDVLLFKSAFYEDVFLYYTEWNGEKNYGTLRMYQDGSKSRLAEEVHDFAITSAGDVLYLYDYSENHYTGELYLCHNGKAKKLDEDVAALLPSNAEAVVIDYYDLGL